MINSSFTITNPFSQSNQTTETEKDRENITVEAIRKAVFLTRYTNLVNSFLTDIRIIIKNRSENDYLITDKSGISFNWWELSREINVRSKTDLEVVNYYKKYFRSFIEEIEAEKEFFGDTSFDEYLNVIKTFNEFSVPTINSSNDD